MSVKDYVLKKGLYLSRIYFGIHSRYRGLLDLDLSNSFERKDFESDIVFHQPTNLELGSSENAVSQSQGQFKDQCNRSLFSNDINFNFHEKFDGDVQGPVSQAAQSQNSGIQNSAQPTKNENIEIENMSSPSQTLLLIKNWEINQPTLENQNATLDSIAIPETNIFSNIEDTAVHSRAIHNGIISPDASRSISEANVQVQNESDDGASQADTIPCDNLRSPVSNTSQKEIVVQRLKLKEDIINEFKKVDMNDKIAFKVIDQAGQSEEGVEKV